MLHNSLLARFVCAGAICTLLIFQPSGSAQSAPSIPPPPEDIASHSSAHVIEVQTANQRRRSRDRDLLIDRRCDRWNPQNCRRYWGFGITPRRSSAHVNWCLDRYRSYNPRNDTFVTYGGDRRRCNSPYN